ncbi:lytic transglycosylase domain-containing protein [Sphingomonas sp. TF3]|uniref:lytic transglycosylase domain-containing protein n=1 Tax=Sphingomonas sp. TF3 TaxID=2495580 RepID=UPI000F864C3D|nr:lytic transglycosylase domain-containing protein [Sphingomonas sp. TF3]RUN77760.1 lytic transglycosylase domain-containing protein [Sphingomonas sp. TF3]
MSAKLALSAAVAAFLTPAAANAAIEPPAIQNAPVRATIPPQLDAEQREGYRAVFASIRSQRWQDAQLQLAALKPGPLHAIAQAELLTAKGSPKADLDPLMKLLADAPELPQAKQILTMAASRGGVGLPPLPEARALTWIDGAPARKRAKSFGKGDLLAVELALKMQPFIKDDRGAEAQALLESTPGLSSDLQTEWQRKIAWMYFLAGDDTNARLMAQKAASGYGDFAVEGQWVGALAAWRQHDCAAAGTLFEGVAARANDVDLRAAALYWAARADMQCARPDRVENRLKSAAQYRETFYGLLARQALGIRETTPHPATVAVANDWQILGRRPNVRVAAALVEIGENGLADSVIRQQARIGDPSEYPALVRLTAALDLPATQIWLSHNGPVGATPPLEARFPAPNWAPDGGWRVDKALVFAHTLQESRFRTDVVSPAGAYGLMQVRPGAATDIARKQGRTFDRSALSRPGTNFEVGQSYLEQLRDQHCTDGLLPKVIAAYNAGPGPVEAWNAQARDGGDPLLYIESIPYWETRGYVTTVLRNYWIYETQTGKTASVSRAALSQGLWPRFPGLPGAAAVRLTSSASSGRTMASTTATSPAGRAIARAD